MRSLIWAWKEASFASLSRRERTNRKKRAGQQHKGRETRVSIFITKKILSVMKMNKCLEPINYLPSYSFILFVIFIIPKAFTVMTLEQ